MAYKWTFIIGALFILTGLMGIVGGFGIVGTTGLFATNVAHDALHIIIGIVLLLISTRASAASSTALMIFGVAYVVLALAGFFNSTGMIIGLMINSADNYLNVVSGCAMLALGFFTRS